MSRSGVPTRAERVYAELRADILAGRRHPGDRLPFADLSARYGASMGVVREALTRLAAEGLVESEPQYGFRVMPISPDDLRHLTEARRAVEPLVLRLAVEHGGLAWEGQLVAAHHRLERTPARAAEDPDRVSEEWAGAHAEFHEALLAGCPNPRLRAVAASLRDAAELYRRWAVSLGSDTHRDIPGEHRAMLDAALAHDADAAAAALSAHIQHTTDVLLTRASTALATVDDSLIDPATSA
ncbi:MAG TPA: GntR family transcriptional regulator [Pseudonocardia sp.]|jgi:DNA-binding GntR family transcriptional regulator|nr:GntR family transcriptional regulator [Pseudonocardia sp.]